MVYLHVSAASILAIVVACIAPTAFVQAVVSLQPGHSPGQPTDVDGFTLRINAVGSPGELSALQFLKLFVTIDGNGTVHDCPLTPPSCLVMFDPVPFDTDVTYYGRAKIGGGDVVESVVTNFTVWSIFPDMFGMHPNIDVNTDEVVSLTTDLSMNGMRTEIILDTVVTDGGGKLKHIDRTDAIVDGTSSDFVIMATIWGPNQTVSTNACTLPPPVFKYPNPDITDPNDKRSMLWFKNSLRDVVRRYGGGETCNWNATVSRCGRVRVWQIGNEVYGSPRDYFWGTIDQYVHTLNEAYDAIKDVDPHAIVVPGGIPGLRQEGSSPNPPFPDPTPPGDVAYIPTQSPKSDEELCGRAKDEAHDLAYVWRYGKFDHYVDVHIYDYTDSIRVKGDWVRAHLEAFMTYENGAAGASDPDDPKTLAVTGLIMSETANRLGHEPNHTADLTHEEQAAELVKRYMFALDSRNRDMPYVQAQWHGPYFGSPTPCQEGWVSDKKALRCDNGTGTGGTIERKSYFAYKTLRSETGDATSVIDLIPGAPAGCQNLGYDGSCDAEGRFLVTEGGTSKCILWKDNAAGHIHRPCGLQGLVHGHNLATDSSVSVQNDNVYVGSEPIVVY